MSRAVKRPQALVLIVFFVSGFCASGDEQPCPRPNSLVNGKILFQSRGGVTAIFTCDVGYVLQGSNVSHCQTDGHWSAPPPSCIPLGRRCNNQAVESIRLTAGESIVLACVPENGPEDELIWVRNGSPVPSFLIQNGSLMTTADKKGMYVCLSHTATAVSILRAVSVAIEESQINLKKSQPCGLVFRDQNTDIAATLGSKVSVSCEVSTFQVHTTWFKDNQPFFPKHSNQTSDSFVNIQSMRIEHEGLYTCVVHLINSDDCYISKTVRITAINTNISESNQNYVCGQTSADVLRRSKRIIDGSRASPQSAPWMCMLSTERNPVFCGCTLITDSWVVTASHCFAATHESEPPRMMTSEEIRNRVKVKLGKQQRRLVEKGEVVRRIRSVVIHPEFRPKTHEEQVTNENDIALIQMSQKVIFKSNILPICLPPPGFINSIPAGTLGTVTGWGRVSVRGSVMALSLQEARLPLVDEKTCQDSTSYIITDKMLCAGYAESYRPDTCYGDSGGPFTLEKDRRSFLAGIVSWGEGCSSPRKFGIYTKVEKYVPWIKSALQLTETTQ